MKKKLITASIIALLIIFNGQDVNADTGYVTANKLRVRAKSSLFSSTIGYLYKNTKVNTISKDGNFYKINYNGKNGYVSNSYIKIEAKKMNNSTSSNKVLKSGIVTANYLNVRSGAGIGYSAMGYIKKNTKVNISDTINGFYKIIFNNKTGYVSASYVKITNTTNETDNINNSSTNSNTSVQTTVKTGETTAMYLNVRTGAGINYPSVGTLIKGTKINIYDTVNGFYKIIYNNKTCYISTLYVKIISSNASNTDIIAPQAVTGVGTILVSVLNVRSMPSATSRVLGCIYPNKKVNIYDLDGDFYKIRLAGEWGYISRAYVHFVKQPLTSAQYVITGPRYTLNTKIDNVIIYAKQFLGMPYLWGGTTPAKYDSKGKYISGGFDCSGFVQYVYGKFGISIPRTTYYQIDIGDSITMENLQKGDLVFFATNTSAPYDVSHVGMYIGENKFIQAPKTGDVIKISDITSYKDKFIIGKRIIK